MWYLYYNNKQKLLLTVITHTLKVDFEVDPVHYCILFFGYLPSYQFLDLLFFRIININNAKGKNFIHFLLFIKTKKTKDINWGLLGFLSHVPIEFLVSYICFIVPRWRRLYGVYIWWVNSGMIHTFHVSNQIYKQRGSG